MDVAEPSLEGSSFGTAESGRSETRCLAEVLVSSCEDAIAVESICGYSTKDPRRDTREIVVFLLRRRCAGDAPRGFEKRPLLPLLRGRGWVVVRSFVSVIMS